ncbi:MAG: FkbM family methyltransferase, partial [Thiohalomonadales bacterium]
MSEKLFNSFYQAVLVKGYTWVAKCIDLETGYGARIYQWLYFRYKSITDRDTLQLLKKVAPPGTTVIDVGANIGFFTLQACRLPQLHVIAFEPGPKNYQNLQKNITKAGYAEIATAFPIALSSHSGSGHLYLSTLAPTDHKIIGSDT